MEASMLLARIFLQEGDLESAKESLEHAIPRHPNHVPAWLLLGISM
jgi:Tfp pilus assembly protein PilF